MSARDSLDEHDLRVERMKRAADEDTSGFTVTILAMAYAEYYLRRLVESKMKTPEAFFTNRANEFVDFSTLVRLAESLGLITIAYSKFLKKFAHLRNKFAHDIDYSATDEDLRAIWKPRESTYQVFLRGVMSGRFERLLSDRRALFDYLVTDMLKALDLVFSKRLDHGRLAVLKERHIQDMLPYMNAKSEEEGRATVAGLIGSDFDPIL